MSWINFAAHHHQHSPVIHSTKICFRTLESIAPLLAPFQAYQWFGHDTYVSPLLVHLHEGFSPFIAGGIHVSWLAGEPIPSPILTKKATQMLHGTGIVTYIYHKLKPNVGKHSIHEAYGLQSLKQSQENNRQFRKCWGFQGRTIPTWLLLGGGSSEKTENNTKNYEVIQGTWPSFIPKEPLEVRIWFQSLISGHVVFFFTIPTEVTNSQNCQEYLETFLPLEPTNLNFWGYYCWWKKSCTS